MLLFCLNWNIVCIYLFIFFWLVILMFVKIGYIYEYILGYYNIYWFFKNKEVVDYLVVYIN